MKKVLVVGASGLLGSRVAREFYTRGYQVYAHSRVTTLPREYLTFSGPLLHFSEVENILSYKFDVIVNCAGLTNVEMCESRPEAAWHLNAILPYWFAQLSLKTSAYFIQISTDHFESELKRPRTELTEMRPLNVYSLSKLCGEKFVSFYNPHASILRTNFFGLTSQRNHSLLDFIVNQFERERTFVGYDNVVFSPIGASELARVIVEVARNRLSGLFNAAGSESLTKYEFSLRVGEKLKSGKLQVVKGLASDNPARTKRPNYLALDSTRLESLIGRTSRTLDDMLTTELSLNI
jgi:dTDP-4-dehydrorhamnose reductase